MLTLGVGRFDNVDSIDKYGTKQPVLGSLDELASHGWLTLQIGWHFDLFGSDD
jgi:hypothetical protein